MAGDYKSIADGCLLIATLGAWNFVLDWSAYRFAPIREQALVLGLLLALPISLLFSLYIAFTKKSS